jgi:hypothetical protein
VPPRWRPRIASAPGRLAAAMATHPQVTLAAATTGPTNLMAAVTGRGPTDLYR